MNGNADKPYVFISFTGKDEEAVAVLCAALHEQGINAVTYESKESEAAFGKNFADWRQFFLARTRSGRCRAVVCYFTRNYFARRTTMEEVALLLGDKEGGFPPVFGYCPQKKHPADFLDEIAGYCHKGDGADPFLSGPDHTFFVQHEKKLRRLFDSHKIVIDSDAVLAAELKKFFPPDAAAKPVPLSAAAGEERAALHSFLRTLRPDAEREAAAREGAKLAAALRRCDTGASVDGFVCGDAVFRYYLHLAEGTPPGHPEHRKKEIARDLRNDGLCFGFDAERDVPYVDVPRADRRAVTAEDFLRAERAEAAAHKGAAEEERPLRFPLGRTVEGRAVFCDLDETPHWLVGAADPQEAGSFLFTAAAWLAERYTPARVRLLLIQLHGAAFAGLEERPHLLGSPLSDPREAIAALHEVQAETERRYMLLYQRSKAGRPVGHIGEYNAAVPENERLPAIVVLIDDVTAFHGADAGLFESCAAAIGSTGRAAGIHLVAAARNCSPHDISGQFKRSFGGRIAFRLSDFTESLNLLEEGGAESLLRGGDLLFKTAQTSSCQRAQAINGGARPAGKRTHEAGSSAQKKPLRLYELAETKLPAQKDGLPFAFGRTDGDGVLFGDFRHISFWLIEGGPGAGKSNFLRALIADAACRHAPARLRFVIADGGGELSCFDELPHLLWPRPDIDPLVALFDEQQRRQELFRKAGATDIGQYTARLPAGCAPLPEIVLVADTPEKADSFCHPIILSTLPLMGKKYGIHTVAALSPDILTPSLLRMTQARVAFRLPDAETSRSILQRSGAEAPALGEFLLKQEGDSDVLRGRSALVTYGEAQQIAAYLKNQTPPSSN